MAYKGHFYTANIFPEFEHCKLYSFSKQLKDKLNLDDPAPH